MRVWADDVWDVCHGNENVPKCALTAGSRSGRVTRQPMKPVGRERREQGRPCILWHKPSRVSAPNERLAGKGMCTVRQVKKI